MSLLNRIFSATVDASRVNPLGIVLMVAAVLMTALSGWISRKLCVQSPDRIKNTIKITGLIICAGGALLAILG